MTLAKLSYLLRFMTEDLVRLDLQREQETAQNAHDRAFFIRHGCDCRSFSGSGQDAGFSNARLFIPQAPVHGIGKPRGRDIQSEGSDSATSQIFETGRNRVDQRSDSSRAEGRWSVNNS